jgi:hypothetical protein
MQTIVQVICTPGRSVRDAIARHPRIGAHGLVVSAQKNPERPHGWTKLHSSRPGVRGAINVQWNADAGILLARVITRAGNVPGPIVADFVDFLMTRLARRIECINVIPRR